MSLAAPALAESRPREALSYDLAPHALALAMFAICAFSPAVLNDGDTWSHIATGDWMLAHHAVPHVDPFTFSVGGKPWTAHEWLSELLLALAYRAGGFVGVSLLTGLAAAAAMFVVMRRVAKDLGGPALVALGVIALILLAPSLLARPHILALPVFALYVDALFAARAENRAPPLAAALLMMLWANLHGGFAFGLALVAPFALEAGLAAGPGQRGAAARDWALFGLASLAAALLNPFGIEGLLFPVRLMGLHALAQIGEWSPESFAHPNALEAAILGLIALALTRPLRVAPLRLVLLIGLLHMSLAHSRHELLLAIVAPMLLARPIAEAIGAPAVGTPAPVVGEGWVGGWPRAATYSERRVQAEPAPHPNPLPASGEREIAPDEHRPIRRSTALAGLAAAMLALTVVRLFLPAPALPLFASTRAALAALPADVKSKPVLNGYAFGGYLIFEGVKPYVDGRADLFGDEFLADYARIARGEHPALETVLTRENIAWTMFAPGQGAVAAMDAEPGWRRVYADRLVVVHARTD
jgi:hypothetical protein